MLFSINYTISLLFFYLITGANSQNTQETRYKSKITYSCTKWSKWNNLEGLKEEILEKYPNIKININDKGDMCQIFNLEKFARDKTPPKKSYGLGIAKTAGLASCLGLTFAIAGALAYSKSNSKEIDDDENEELINDHLESEQS